VVGCSTEKVFKLSDTMDLKIGNVEDVIKALEEGDDVKLAQSICNSLEPAAISLVPEIQVIIDKLKMHGLNIVQMSGSGSAVFAMSTDKKLIKNVAKELEKEYLVELTKVLK
jgi:4-diphosphocytidyl-2C-methyl-D-erythritol kinase